MGVDGLLNDLITGTQTEILRRIYLRSIDTHAGCRHDRELSPSF
jgi:hypothetical protein